MRISDFARDQILGWRAEILSWRLLFGLGSLQVAQAPYAWSFGVLGVGIHSLQGEKIVVLVPGAVVAEGQIVPISKVPQILAAVASVALAGESWDDVFVWGVSDPTQHVGAGDRIRGAKSGTAGAPVQWSAGGATAHGILTAEHVAGAGAAVATRAGAPIGSVVAAAAPALAGVDVAAIDLAAPATTARLAAVAVTGASMVDLWTLPAKKQGQIIAKTGWFYWPRYSVTYVDLYVTYAVISSGGDSGSAATLAGANEFVGTLVGASSGSLIQDGRTQLGALSALPNLTL
jgi:hypothetical protein